MSPEIVDDVKDEATDAFKPGVMYGLGTTLGTSMLGGIGYAAGGVIAGSQIGGNTGKTLSALAISEGMNRTILSGGSSGGSSRGRM